VRGRGGDDDNADRVDADEMAAMAAMTMTAILRWRYGWREDEVMPTTATAVALGMAMAMINDTKHS